MASSFFLPSFGVKGLGLACEKGIEILFDIGELAGEDVYSLELVFGRAALPEHERAVKKIGVLPETLFTGDGATFLGGDDLFFRSSSLAAKSLSFGLSSSLS